MYTADGLRGKQSNFPRNDRIFNGHDVRHARGDPSTDDAAGTVTSGERRFILLNGMCTRGTRSFRGGEMEFLRETRV